jgi:hypothetical protein
MQSFCNFKAGDTYNSQWSDSVLPVGGWRTPEGAFIDQYGAMMEWLAGRETEKPGEKPAPISSTTNLIWDNPELSPKHRSEKPVPKHLCYGMACDTHIIWSKCFLFIWVWNLIVREVLTAVVMKNIIFLGTTSCNPLEANRRFAIWFHVSILLGLFLDHEDGGDMFLLSIGSPSADYTPLYVGR